MDECHRIDVPQDLTSHLSLALSKVHAKGVLHRDISPSNLLATDSGDLVLIDFGLSSFLCGISCRDSLSPNMTTIITRHPNMLGRYGTEVDCYSAGVCALVYLAHKTYRPDPEFVETDILPYIQSARDKEEEICPERSKVVERLFAGICAPVQTLQPLTFKRVPGVPDLKDYATRELLVPTEHTHRDLVDPLVESTRIYVSFHQDCLSVRAKQLCASICDGRCKLWSTVSVCICIGLHGGISASVFSFFASYANTYESSFRASVADALCASLHDLRWMLPCTRRPQTNVV
jgi:serine/threonine protein kinase